MPYLPLPPQDKKVNYTTHIHNWVMFLAYYVAELARGIIQIVKTAHKEVSKQQKKRERRNRYA